MLQTNPNKDRQTIQYSTVTFTSTQLLLGSSCLLGLDLIVATWALLNSQYRLLVSTLQLKVLYFLGGFELLAPGVAPL